MSKGAGNLGVMAFGVGVGLCAVLTAIVMALAYSWRLPGEVVRRRMAAAD